MWPTHLYIPGNTTDYVMFIIFFHYDSFTYKQTDGIIILYPHTDSSLTTDNISAALAMLNNKDLEKILYLPNKKMVQLRQRSSSPDEYRIQLINYWRKAYIDATWERMGSHCFYEEKEKALNEVKKHFQWKLGMLLSHSYSISSCINI